MSNSARKKPARTSRKTVTTKAAKGCGFVTFGTDLEPSVISASLEHTIRFGKAMSSISAVFITGKSTKSTGPFSPSGCAKNISNAAAIGLGRRPRNSWLSSDEHARLGFFNLWQQGKKYKVVIEALPFVPSREMIEDDVYPDMRITRGVSQ